MNKNIKHIFALIFTAFVIFLLPSVLNNYFAERKTDAFFERLDGDFGECVKDANEDAKSIDWCKKIKRSSELAFKSARRVSDTDFDVSFLQVILFVLAGFVLTLKRRVENLENK